MICLDQWNKIPMFDPLAIDISKEVRWCIVEKDPTFHIFLYCVNLGGVMKARNLLRKQISLCVCVRDRFPRLSSLFGWY